MIYVLKHHNKATQDTANNQEGGVLPEQFGIVKGEAQEPLQAQVGSSVERCTLL